METYLAFFSRAAAQARPDLDARQIETGIGRWHDSTVLKLQKRRWTLAARAATASEAGIFFSVWLDEKSLKQHRVRYNIHALKLRTIPGFALQSREFAAAFRSAFSSVSREWPHVSTDYGPQTLMEGWIPSDPEKIEAEVAALIRRFLPLADVIDQLLDQRTS